MEWPLLIGYNNLTFAFILLMFFSWVSSPKLLGGRKGMFYTSVYPSEGLAQCLSLGGSPQKGW